MLKKKLKEIYSVDTISQNKSWEIVEEQLQQFAGQELSVVATGGNAPVIVRYCKNKIVYDKYLLMEGLWTIYQKNK